MGPFNFFRNKSKKSNARKQTTKRKSAFLSRFELLEAKRLLAGDVFQNPVNQFDVNNDGFVSPSDAAAIAFHSLTSRSRGTSGSGEPTDIFLDVNGDGELTGDDMTAVINQLNGSGEPGDAVTFRFEVRDLSDNVVTEVASGDQFDLIVYGEDTSDDPSALFAAYLDIVYPDNLLTAEQITYGAVFDTGETGSLATPGLIDEVGAFDQSGLEGEKEIFRVRMRADAPGQAEISSNPGDNVPLSDVLTFSSNLAVNTDDILYPTLDLQITGTQQGENDLVAFAEALAADGVVLWTSGVNADADTLAQLDVLKEGQRSLNTNEVFDYVDNETGAARFPISAAANAASVSQTNIWIWGDGTRSDGSVLTLEEISAQSGVAIPQSDNPSIVAIDDVTVAQSLPLHIPLDGYDPNGDPLTYTVTVSDPSLVDTFIPQDNRSISIPVSRGGEDLGDLVFELFEGRAPRPTSRIIELAEAGFHEDIIFHRVIDEFMIQGGDPTGTGSGGSTLGDFDDQFHVDLVHTSPGLLSMAKSNDDTNDSQFFITEVPTPWLDFNHSVFGQMVEGETIRQMVSNVETGFRDRPNEDVSMGAFTVFEDTENAVLMLEALATSGSTTVTVTATDVAGNFTTETFTVDLTTPSGNRPPFLEDFGDPVLSPDNPEFQVSVVDIENSDFTLEIVNFTGTGDESLTVNEQGVVTASGFVGSREATIRVTGASTFAQFGQDSDEQRFTVTVRPEAPTAVDLLASTDSGLSDSDDITNLTDLDFEVSGVEDGQLVILFSGDTEIGRGLASGTTAQISQANTSALGSGEQLITAVVEIDGVRSVASPTLRIELDQAAPATVSNAAPTEVRAGATYAFDADHEDEGTGEVQYSLANAPAGMTIDSTTGEVSWIPSSTQVGEQAFDIVVTDIAGNQSTSPFTVTVTLENEAAVSLNLRDAGGTDVGTITVGDEFFIDVFVEGLRADTGLSQAFVDLTFDTQGVAIVDAGGTISVSAAFGTAQQTGTVSTGGVADVGGEADTPVVGRTLLATIPMVAQGEGTLTIDVTPGSSGIQFDGETQTIAVEDILLQSDQVFVLDSTGTLTANDDTLTIDEDSGEHTIEVLANDTVDGGNASITITDVTTPSAGGTVRISDDSLTLIYEPPFNVPRNFEAATDEFSYTISDGNSTSTANVTVTIAPVNDPPQVTDDNFPADLDNGVTSEESRLTALRRLREDSTEAAILPVLLNDFIDGFESVDILQVTSAQSSTSTVAPFANTEFTGELDVSYTPGPNVSGFDTFTYEVTDRFNFADRTFGDDAITVQGTVTVYVAQVNDAPVANPDSISVIAGQTVNLDQATFLDNDNAGPLEDDQTITIDTFTQPSQGTLTQNSDGSFTYVANAGASGTDTFEYTIIDDGITEDFNETQQQYVSRNDSLTATGTVTITITEGNVAPQANDDSFTVVNDGSAVPLTVASNDTDDLTPNLTVTAVGDTTAGGTVTLTDGVVSYQPATDFVGTDTFTYTISDGELTDTATVTVTVVQGGTETNSRFTGRLFFDANNDGTQDQGEAGIAGVPLNLSGTDDAGNAVDLQVYTDLSGNYSFTSIPKGSFQIRQTQSPFLLDGGETAAGFATADGDDAFSVTVGDNVVISDGNTFAERGLSPKLALLDALSRRRGNGFLTAVDSQGSQFVRNPVGWDGFSSIRLELSSDETQLTIRATDQDSRNVSTTVSMDDKTKVSIIGRDNGTMLMRIVAPASAFDFDDESGN